MSSMVSAGVAGLLSHIVCPARLPLSLSFGSKEQLLLGLLLSDWLQLKRSPYLERTPWLFVMGCP